MTTPILQTKHTADFTGIAASAISTCLLPPYGTLYAARTRHLTSASAAIAVADIKSEISNVILRASGEVLVDSTPTFLFDLQNYYGSYRGEGNIAGVLPLFPFMSPNMRLPGERRQLAFGTQGLSQIIAEYTMAGTITNHSGGKIEPYLDVTPEVRPPGPHLRLTKHPQVFSTTGEQEVSTLPIVPGTGIKAIHINTPGSSTITQVSVIVNNNEILQNVPPIIQQSRLESFQRDPQTGYYHIDFNVFDEILGYLPMDGVQDFRLRITWATAAPSNYNIYMERYWDLNAPTGLVSGVI